MFVGLALSAVKILPNLGQGSTEQAVRLLGAQEPFLQRSAVARVTRLADTDESLHTLVAERAPVRLLALLHADADAGVMEAVVDALAALCRLEEGREACVLAGAVDALEAATQGGWVRESRARERTSELLLALTIQRDNLD
ncbi:hypothetical protein WJX81_000219 [Elliptochloris bilobata]|uniref:Uncharacterized protein n=1 Tax=Elliptochloris bilobata TaxID=381761 RepID=A0AAW1RBE2_9CHLO